MLSRTPTAPCLPVPPYRSSALDQSAMIDAVSPRPSTSPQ